MAAKELFHPYFDAFGRQNRLLRQVWAPGATARQEKLDWLNTAYVRINRTRLLLAREANAGIFAETIVHNTLLGA